LSRKPVGRHQGEHTKEKENAVKEIPGELFPSIEPR